MRSPPSALLADTRRLDLPAILADPDSGPGTHRTWCTSVVSPVSLVDRGVAEAGDGERLGAQCDGLTISRHASELIDQHCQGALGGSPGGARRARVRVATPCKALQATSARVQDTPAGSGVTASLSSGEAGLQLAGASGRPKGQARC